MKKRTVISKLREDLHRELKDADLELTAGGVGAQWTITNTDNPHGTVHLAWDK